MNYFNEQIERMPIADLRKLQLERLQHTIANVYKNVPYYKNLFDTNGIKPEDIKSLEDLHKIPFTKKATLRDEYPFGLFTLSTSSLARLHCSSGTTGKPTVVGYTQNDIDVFSEIVARSLTAAGCKPGMILQNAYGYGLFTGGLGLHYGAEKMGMCVLPISGGFTDKQIMLMQDFKTSAICCTPSYACTLAEALESRGISPEELSLKIAILGAEPWTETSRQKVEKGLGVTATNIYGLSEIMGPGVSQEDYEEKETGSYIWEDHFYPEVVDKDTGEPLPYGEKGVLVFTSLTKEAMPMLRYYTNDIAEIYYDKSAKRTHVKMSQIYGRADDMLIIRGVNLFPTQVEAVLQHFEHLSPHYQIEVAKVKDMDTVSVQVELLDEVYQSLLSSTNNPLEHDTVTQHVARFQKRIKDDIGLSMHVECCIPNSLPRSEGGKLSKIKDKR